MYEETITARLNNGQQQAPQPFPFGIDPRSFGLNQIEYERALAHHRKMEHHDIMREKHAERENIQLRIADRDWWLQPVNSFFQWIGGAFWLACWMYVIIIALAAVSSWSAQRDANWCLKDVAKCEAIAKGAK